MVDPAHARGRAGLSAGGHRVVQVATVDYRYELRRGEEVIATGHLSRERAMQVGERIVIAGRPRDRP